MRGDSTSARLSRLERLRLDYGGDAPGRKLELLRGLEKGRLRTAAEVSRLHEVLCFLRAYPDDAQVLARAERLLGAFDRRPDLRRHRSALADTGIAGTEIRFRFFAPTASWLARRWPRRLRIDWRGFESQDRLEHWLPLVAHYAETPALDEYALSVREWVRRLKGPAETDAAFLVRRFGRLRMDGFARETLYDELDPPMVLSAAADTPSRTRAKRPVARVAFQRRPLARGRPALRPEILRPPLAVRALDAREGRRLVDLAREAMVTRQRDLDVFSYGDADDVRLVDCGEGLELACIGATPGRRLLLEAVYGYLTLKNGVPVGYVLSAALFGSAEVAYNVFETYRGAEASAIFGRVLAIIRHLFGADSFMIPPYQLGEGNDEALSTGAWWFYQKLGFRPREAAVARRMRRELRIIERRASHRSSVATLKRLARANLYFHLGARRDDVLGEIALPNVGLHVMRYLAGRFGADRERATRVCAAEAAELLGVRGLRGWGSGERLALERWGPLVLLLPGVTRWSGKERRALAAVIRAKGGRRESDFVRAFDRHPKLPRAIRTLAGTEPRP